MVILFFYLIISPYPLPHFIQKALHCRTVLSLDNILQLVKLVNDSLQLAVCIGVEENLGKQIIVFTQGVS